MVLVPVVPYPVRVALPWKRAGRDRVRSLALVSVGLSVALGLASSTARADETQLHGELGVAHAVGNPQQREYGFGGSAAVAGELTFAKVVGIQAELSFLGLSDGSAPTNPALANHGAGFDFGAMAGVRIHPFAQHRVAGLWLDGNAGLSVTGSALRAGIDTHVGYDFRVGHGRFDLGPFIGYAQVFQPDNALRPEDAHTILGGLQVSLGEAIPPPPRPRTDRDGDGVFDDEDACPDTPGIRTSDRRTNGCPRGDRDGDTIFDDEDACPDTPGIRTTDPKTNGCPAAGDQVRLVGDKILLDEIIHFDKDSPRIHHVSWPICQKVASFIQANPDVLEVDIEGHADETGTSAHNLVLSRTRADAVKLMLVKYGIDPKRITTHAYGEKRPKVPGHAEEQLRQNRRVEFTVTRSRARATELNPSGPGDTKSQGLTPGGERP